MRAWLAPLQWERRYRRFLNKIVNEFRAQVKVQLKLKLLRKDEDDLKEQSDYTEEIIAALLLWWLTRRQTIRYNISGYFSEVAKFNDTQFRAVVKNVTGISLPTSQLTGYIPGLLVSQTQDIISRLGETADYYREEKYIQPIRNNWESTQETYINKTITETVSNIELAIRNTIVTSVGLSALETIVNKIIDTTEKRVEKFSENQIHNLDTQLTENRQKSIGADKYDWETQRDERVRGNPNGLYPNAKPSHFARQGQTFSWNNPPEGGHPGQAPGCRCRAIFRLG